MTSSRREPRTLEPCPELELADAFQIYVRRIEWMNAKKLRHWNVLGYFEIYPYSYFEERRRQGEFFVYRDDVGAIVGAVVLRETDASWQEGDVSSAYYVHNLATEPSVREVGATIMRLVHEKAVADGKRFLRLDCDEVSVFLNEYYDKLGYKIVGKCAYGEYRGVRRQLALVGG